MEGKLPVNENLETLFNHLQKFLSTETVIGEPISVGETTLIPIITVTFGCGGGGGGGTDDKGIGGTGTGVGVGARITPDAILVIKNGEVNMLPIKGKFGLDKLVEMVPEIVKKIKFKKDKCEEE